MNLTSGYNQVAAEENDKHKTVLQHHSDFMNLIHCRSVYATSPPPFRDLCNFALEMKYSNFYLYFLDDIIVFSRTIGEQIDRLEAVFKKLRQHELKLKPAKCLFFKEEVHYLGHIVNERGVSMCTSCFALL